MSGQKNGLHTLGFVVSVSLVAAAVSALLAFSHGRRASFELLNAVCGEVAEQEPEAMRSISAALKEYTRENPEGTAQKDILSSWGYGSSDFTGGGYRQNMLFAATGLLVGISLFMLTYWHRNKREALRMQALADYLEQVNIGKAVILSPSGEDDFSKLEDEIYKTVTYLYQTRDAAVQTRNDFADNLSNIAHQIKTPITAISLSVQMMKQEFMEGASACSVCKARAHVEQVERQLLRLTHLEEALLVLARIDAGTLFLQRDEIDVFTLLILAAENLQELLADFGTTLEIPELGEMRILGDLDWTMEAVMNLMKNCMEHSRGGAVHCSYTQNSLYTEILIWDEGEGFAKEDLPHLFERFYRGQNVREGGIGIGLALSKEIIERQNGTIQAKNRLEGGACFEIRFYSH